MYMYITMYMYMYMYSRFIGKSNIYMYIPHTFMFTHCSGRRAVRELILSPRGWFYLVTKSKYPL